MKTIILAAGQGTRMKSQQPKVVHKILNKCMINYVIDATKKANKNLNEDEEEIIVIIGYKGEEVKKAISEDIKFVFQEEQLGTGHCVKMAKEHIKKEDTVLIMYSDTPLITSNTIESLYKKQKEKNSDVVIVSTEVENPIGYGRVVIDKNYIRIVEDKDATEEEKNIKLINVGLYMFKGEALLYALDLLKPNNKQNEYYLTDTIEILLKNNYKADTLIAKDTEEFLGINNKMQLGEVSNILKEKINKEHMNNGVTIIDYKNTYISPDVKIGTDTEVYPNTIITGNTIIGSNCKIGSNCNLNNCTIGDNVIIESTVATECKIGDFSKIGPFAYIRPNSTIGENCKIGDFVEIKNSKIDNNTKASHLTYIGDSEVGKNVNFGCGTVTVNYDGTNKYKTIIEDNVFIGCNANLVAPVKLESNSFIGAGSTITKDVGEGMLAIARTSQTNNKNWKGPRKK